MARKTVLLVEDNLADRDMYANILWYNGYDVVVAADGEAGLRLAHEQHPDLIVLDLELPLMHGSELCSRVKQNDDTRDIPVLALTGRRLREFGGDAALLGYAGFLEKPVSPLAVLSEVERLIGRAQGDQAEAPEHPRVVETPVMEQPPRATPERQRIADQLRFNIPTIVARWEDLIREEPWFSLPREGRVNNMAHVIEAVASVALLSPESRTARRKAVMAAAEHGYARRRIEVPETMVPIEFHLLRQALWRYLNDTLSPSEETYAAIVEIDRSITMALNAAMWGYYRDEIGAHDGWENALEKLVNGDVTGKTKEPA